MMKGRSAGRDIGVGASDLLSKAGDHVITRALPPLLLILYYSSYHDVHNLFEFETFHPLELDYPAALKECSQLISQL